MCSVEQPDESPETPATGQPSHGSDRTEARRPSWRSLIVGLAIAFVMVTIMATTYVWANHGLVAHDLP